MNFSKNSDTSLKFTNFEGIFSVKVSHFSLSSSTDFVNTQGKEKDIELLHDAIECRMREMAKKVKSDSQSAACSSHTAPPITPVTKSPPVTGSTPTTSSSPSACKQKKQTSSSPASSSPSSSNSSDSSSSSHSSSASPSASLSSDPSLIAPILKPAAPLDQNGPKVAATELVACENGESRNDPEVNGVIAKGCEQQEEKEKDNEVAAND